LGLDKYLGCWDCFVYNCTKTPIYHVRVRQYLTVDQFYYKSIIMNSSTVMYETVSICFRNVRDIN